MKKDILRAFLITLLLFSPLISEGFTENVFSTKLHSAIIVIDVGHGGSDPGKVSPDGIEEKNINLAIAKYLQDYLIAQDYTVFLTRGFMMKMFPTKKDPILTTAYSVSKKKTPIL